MADCRHRPGPDGRCAVCAQCLHEMVLNGACTDCGATDIAVTVKPVAADLVPLSRLSGKKAEKAP